MFSPLHDDIAKTFVIDIDIEHIQNSESRCVSSLEEASQWMQEVQAETEKAQEIEAE